MRDFVTGYLGAAIVFFAVDMLWLTTVAPGFYRERIGNLLLDRPNMAAAGLFYLVYVAGIVHFAVMPTRTSGDLTTAVLNGAFLGLVAYGTYDMTNLATLRGWSISLSLVDMAWGTALTALAAFAGALALRWTA